MSGIPENLATSLENRYRLEREVGRGGMATVYLARDIKHNREVAVKVLRPDLAETLGTDRFLREIEIAAQLNHPHILPLLDSEEADGQLLYIMPFVDGDSLRIQLNRRRRLTFERAMSVTREVADGLAYAHRRGVVHRDIKPENILFTEGHAIISDFGIAKAVSTLGARELTRTGFPIGTPGYMSPEQAAGRMDLDGRSDVYSLACVCYEMLVGDVPTFWLSDRAVSEGKILDAPKDHRLCLDNLPPQVERTLAAALAVRPEDRVPNPTEFVNLLTRPSGTRRRYSNTEVKDIMGRAAEIERNRPTETGALTAGGIKEIGAEVGLSTRDVRAAIQATEPRNPDMSLPAKLGLLVGGAPASISLERVIDGEVPESEYPHMVDEIRLTLRNVGNVSTLAGSLTWNYARSGSEGRDLHITLVSRSNSTRIRIDERLGAVAGGFFGGIVGGGGGGGGSAVVGTFIGTTGSPIAGVVAGALWVSSCYLFARTLFSRTHRKRYNILVDLINRLAEHAAATAVDNSRLISGRRQVSPS